MSGPGTGLTGVAGVDRVPPGVGLALSAGGRLLGVAFLAVIALDESYDRTQVFAVSSGLLVIASLLWRWDEGAFFGAGMVFFSGASLSVLDLGWAVMAAGVMAVAGAGLVTAREGRRLELPVLGFFAAAAGVVGLVVVIALAVEG